MKMKANNSIKKVVFFTMLLAISTIASLTAVAARNDVDKCLLESLSAIGISSDVPVHILTNTNFQPFSDNTVMPHLSLSQYADLSNLTESDVDILLAFAEMVQEQQLSGFSWDTAIDAAIKSANLYEYWTEGFRAVTESTRQQQLTSLATNYTKYQLVEMGVFLRAGIIEEFNELGFFLADGETTIGFESLNFSLPNISSTIPRMTFSGGGWRSHNVVFAGDRVSYSITYRLAADTLLTRFATGLARSGATGVGHFREYVALVMDVSSSRTIHVVGSSFGPEVFGIQHGGGHSFILSGSYQILR